MKQSQGYLCYPGITEGVGYPEEVFDASGQRGGLSGRGDRELGSQEFSH